MAGLTAEGYELKRASDYLAEFRADYELATGLTIAWDYDAFLGNVSAIHADRLGALDEVLQAVYDAWDPNNAAGVQLTNLCLIVGVPRRDATYSTATVTLSGTAGTVVQQGKRVAGGGEDDDVEWAVTADAVIGGGGTVDVIVQALEAGAVVATVGAIDAIVTPVAGWDSVTNAADAIPGQDRETDAELRVRRLQSLQSAGAGSPNAIRANLLALVDSDGVAVLSVAVVLENDEIYQQTIDGETLDGKSILVIVWPNTLTSAEQQLVGQAIYDLKAAGIKTMGTDVVTQVTGADLAAKTIAFDYATTVDIDVTVTVEMEALQAGLTPPPVFADVETEIAEIVADYFLALRVGDDVRRLSLAALISLVEGVRYAQVELAKSPATPSDQDITILIGELAVADDITVQEAP